MVFAVRPYVDQTTLPDDAPRVTVCRYVVPSLQKMHQQIVDGVLEWKLKALAKQLAPHP